MICSSFRAAAYRDAPLWTITSSLAWTPPIGGSGLRGLFYFDGRYMSSFNTGSDLDIEKTEKAFTVFNGRVGLHGPADAWAIELWGQNLLNKRSIQVAFDAPLQGTGTTRGVRGGLLSAVDAALWRVPRRAADIRDHPAREAGLQPAGAAALRRAACASAGRRAAGVLRHRRRPRHRRLRQRRLSGARLPPGLWRARVRLRAEPRAASRSLRS